MPEAGALGIFDPHMQQACEEEMGIQGNGCGIVIRMQLSLVFSPFIGELQLSNDI